MLRTTSRFAVKVRDIPAAGLSHALSDLDEWAVGVLAEVERGARVAGLRADLTLHIDGDDVTVCGELTGDVVLRCGRCLGDAQVSVAARVGLQFVPPGEAAKVDADAEDAPDVKAYHDGVIDLETTLREELLLALPMVPLCGESCKGLCPCCGQDLNHGACTCAPQAVDDRWAALRGVKL